MFNRRLLLSLTSTALLFAACSKEEESLPEPTPKPQAQEEALPELSDMEELRTAAPPAKSAETYTGVPQPASHGLYVLQVGVWDNGPSAKKQAKELEAAGVPAYVVKVENPGGLQGDFWRVRVGYFSTVPDARMYGETLKSKGIAFWIDNKSNDDVGTPGSASAPAAQNDYPTATLPAEPAAPASEQVQEPSAAPASEQVQESPAAPAAAADDIDNSDDGWN